MKTLFEKSVALLNCLNECSHYGCSHVEEISKNTRVDVEKVRKINYLFEFDRYVRARTVCGKADTTIESFRVRLGAIRPKEHTTVMHPLPIRF